MGDEIEFNRSSSIVNTNCRSYMSVHIFEGETGVGAINFLKRENKCLSIEGEF